MQAGKRPLRPRRPVFILLFYLGCIALMVGAALLASFTQQGFGKVEVANIWYKNGSGIPVRAKLYRPRTATPANKAPGIVYIHGYQNNRETSDPFCIEFARRGFVAMCIDAIGRGNSGIPLRLEDPSFDKTYGAKASLDHLKGLDYVDGSRVGVMGNSIGGELAYEIALVDPSVQALVFSGYAFDDRATFESPNNMLMIYGKFDEFRDLMTQTDDVELEWMRTESVKRAISEMAPVPGVTYGDFDRGTARRVEIPAATHLQVPHSRAPIAAALESVASSDAVPYLARSERGNHRWLKQRRRACDRLVGQRALSHHARLQARRVHPQHGDPDGAHGGSLRALRYVRTLPVAPWWGKGPLCLLDKFPRSWNSHPAAPLLTPATSCFIMGFRK